MASIRKQPTSKFYWLYYYDDEDGDKYKGKSLGVTTKKEAEKLRREFEAEQKARKLRKKREAKANAKPREHRDATGLREPDQLAEMGLALDEYGHEIVEDPAKYEAYNKEQALKDADEAARLKAELEANDPMFEEMWAKWRSWAERGNRAPNTVIAYNTAAQLFIQLMKPKSASSVTPSVIKGFIAKAEKTPSPRTGEPISRSAVRQYLVCLQGIYSTAIREGWFVGENPVQIPWKKKKDRFEPYLEQDQIANLLDAAKALEKNTYLLVAIAVHTGMRKGEVANLRWEDFQFDRKDKKGKPAPVVNVQAKKADPKKKIKEFRPKSAQARTIPLKKELIEILEPYRQKEGYVIQSVSGEVALKRDRYNAPAQFKQACQSAGVPHCTVHMLRHTFASQAAISGKSIYKISRWLGHSTVQITADTYAHLQEYDEEIDGF